MCLWDWHYSKIKSTEKTLEVPHSPAWNYLGGVKVKMGFSTQWIS